MSADSRTLVIEARPRFHLLDWREIAEYRDLLFFLTWRDIAVRYKQSVLGYLWAFVQPLTQVLVYTVIFGVLLRVPSSGVSYPLFTLAGVIAWTYFNNVVQQGANSLVSEQAVITKVYFPRILVPLTPCLAFLVDLGIALALTLIATVVWTGRVYPALVWLPVYVLLLIVTGFGTGVLLSSLNVRYRDIRQGTALLLQLGMYVTPVIWPIDQVRRHFPSMYWLIGLNPLASVVGGFRAGLLGLEPVPMRMMALSAASAGAMLVLGLWYFHKTEDVIADIV